jgi:acetyl esterase/lipase
VGDRTQEALEHPLLSVVHLPDFKGLVQADRMLVTAGGAEMMVRDIDRMVGAARAHGVDVAYECCKDMPHAHVMFLVPQTLPSQQQVADFIASVLPA